MKTNTEEHASGYGIAAASLSPTLAGRAAILFFLYLKHDGAKSKQIYPLGKAQGSYPSTPEPSSEGHLRITS